MSKLAALAKNRKQAGDEQSKSTLASVNLLGKLSSVGSSKISSESSSPLSKLQSRLRQSTPSPNTVIPPPSKVSKPEAVVRKFIRRFPEIDLDVSINIPDCIRASSSALESLFIDIFGIENRNSTKVANTIFLPDTVAKDVKGAFAKPSPDDIVLNAQERGLSAIETGVKKLDINNSRRKTTTVAKALPNKKNIEEVLKHSDNKPSVNFVVIGHVDAGKSTLMGRLLYDAGVVDKHIIEKYKRESERSGKGSFALAWVLDQTEEERRRGVTIDFCMSSFETSKARFTIVDAPGHRDFIPNMIAGSAQADLALLVVDASTNGFESGFNLDGQTREHAILVRSLGVSKIIVAINKLDMVEWSQERFDEIRLQLGEFLEKIGFKKTDTSFVPTSGLLGDNVVTSKSKKTNKSQWYNNGPTLLSELESNSEKITMGNYNGPLQMLVSDVSVAEHMSDVRVSGRIASGSIQVGEAINVVPGGGDGVIAQMKSLTRNSSVSEWAVAGDNVTLNLSGVELEDISIGDVVCGGLDSTISCVKKVRARIVVFDLQRPILKGTKLSFHRGRIHESAKVSQIVSVLDKASGEVLKSKPRLLTSSQSAVVDIELDTRPLPMEAFRLNKELGRFILRKDGSTIAAGVVDELIKDE